MRMINKRGAATFFPSRVYRLSVSCKSGCSFSPISIWSHNRRRSFYEDSRQSIARLVRFSRRKRVIDVECHQQLREQRVFLSRILAEDIRLPDAWIEEKPELPKNLAEEITISRPGGFVAPVKGEILRTLTSLGDFVRMISEGGEYAKFDSLPEARLQADARRHLRTQGLQISEGSEVGGGETDLLVAHKIIIENKIVGETNDPMSENRPYPFQARRYSIALCKTVFFTLVAYKPRSETGLLPQSSSIAVRKVPDIPEDCLEIRFVVPYGTGRPSEVSKPVASW